MRHTTCNYSFDWILVTELLENLPNGWPRNCAANGLQRISGPNTSLADVHPWPASFLELFVYQITGELIIL
ncbi:hypothetical protein CSKR_202407 [Clonorchis sinensis]|uniref:Uncharacterized protein n=1 Tax=Clonorchis sinensis TaxID=79923 RepID=A0A8T1MUS2_CLOSI|nr:hypothetical protein CSKR_202407 [Clonorchis sinensis]